MSTIRISDAIHERLADVAGQRGESVDDFVDDLLKEFLQMVDGVKPRSLHDALADARIRIEHEGTPLISSWDELELELAERRGGYYSN